MNLYSLHENVKRSALIVLLVMLTGTSNAVTYYFSTSEGDDNRTAEQAMSPRTPWKSIEKLNEFFKQLRPGDSVVFKSGEHFFGTIKATRAGTDSARIYFSTYGGPQRAVITGFTEILEWEDTGNAIWKASLTKNVDVNVMIVDGYNTPMGRYPNFNKEDGGFLKIESHDSLNHISNHDLVDTVDWKGAEAVVRKNRWIIDRDPVIDHSGQELQIKPTSGYAINNGYGFFIQNHKGTLDLDGEWYHQKDSGVVFMKSGISPAERGVRASVNEDLFIAHNFGSFKISHLVFEGANSTIARIQNAENVTFDSCTFRYAGNRAVFAISSKRVSITNSEITEINNVALSFDPGSRFAQMRNNRITKVGVVPGSSASGNESSHAIVSKGNNAVIENNFIDSIGYIVIRFEGNDLLIKNNFINHFLMTKDDGAAIYTWKGAKNTVQNWNRKIIGNIILNGEGERFGAEKDEHIIAAGIYLDDAADHIDVINNTVANCSYAGLYLHNTQYIKVEANTFYNNGQQVSMVHDWFAIKSPIREINFTDNVLFSTQADQNVLAIRSIKDDIAEMGLFNNNHYNRPRDRNFFIETEVKRNDEEISELLDTEGWQIGYKHDLETSSTGISREPVFKSRILDSNRVENGEFKAGKRDEVCISSKGACSVDWVKESSLDGGALRVSFPDKTKENKARLMLGIGKVEDGKTYAIRFTIVGKPTIVPLQLNIQTKNRPFITISETKLFKLAGKRNEHTIYLRAVRTEENAALVFEIQNPNSDIDLDNLEVNEAIVTEEFPDQNIRFEYNASQNPKRIDLNTDHVDGRGTAYSGVITLKPFSSVILIEEKKREGTSETKVEQTDGK
ncbi:MAG: right-handed parallel beta-helix repeat-containing protein [Flavitalea sp.]